jgi:hypothetical protein
MGIERLQMCTRVTTDQKYKISEERKGKMIRVKGTGMNGPGLSCSSCSVYLEKCKWGKRS